MASGIAVADWARHFDTVSVCFSKGLGAPVGSALAGPRDLIRLARRHRKVLGGGMRQAGIIAAGALYALENHVERLAEDHANAQRLAEAIRATEGLELQPPEIDTNMVIFHVDPALATAAQLVSALQRVRRAGPRLWPDQDPSRHAFGRDGGRSPPGWRDHPRDGRKFGTLKFWSARDLSPLLRISICAFTTKRTMLESAMRFTKMHGAGNDYVYVNGFEEALPSDLPDLARRISDRRFGVGGDGLILILPSAKADARMQMFNADGSEAEMCGNGIRCVAKYVYDYGIASQAGTADRNQGRRLVVDGVHGWWIGRQGTRRHGAADPGRRADPDDPARRSCRQCGIAGRRAQLCGDQRVDGQSALCDLRRTGQRRVGAWAGGRRSRWIRIFPRA